METDHATALQPPVICPIPLLRIRATYPIVLHINGPGVSIWMHWLPDFKRTMPCVRRTCPYCRAGLPRRPLTYIPAMVLRGASGFREWRRVVLEVPLRAGKELFDLQGKGVILRRVKHCGPIDILAANHTELPADPRRFDVFGTLRTLWRIPASSQVALVSDGYTE